MSLRVTETQSTRPYRGVENPAQKPYGSPVSFPTLAITQIPAQTSNSLVLCNSCCKCYKLFPSGPNGKSDCQKNVPKAGGKRKIVKAAMSQLENRKSGSTTKRTEVTPEAPQKFGKKMQHQRSSARGPRHPQTPPSCSQTPERTGEALKHKHGVKN